MTRRTVQSAAVFLVFLPVGAAGDDPPGVDFSRDILPILSETCFQCHGPDENAREAELRLDTKEGAHGAGESGKKVVIPGRSSESELIRRITATDPDDLMPPRKSNRKLTGPQIEMLKRWVDTGAPWGKHWAYEAPRRAAVPEIQSSKFKVQNPVDSFIFARLEKEGAAPSPEAPRATLLRRLHVDLLGVTPTREELQAFLADPSPDAYERVVDRLLNDPRHGERWARHWMDVWRYSDWFGRRMVPDVWNSAPQIWRWRDWIVKSLNSGKGYDRMVQEMLAADEIAPLDDESVVATGYLVRNWYALNPNDWMRANVEHTGRAFLGLTFQCAHCHDHKYDPITQADYFGFRAFFEPLYVRQDRRPGEADPGPFQDYEYTKNRKVQRLGAIRVFDRDAESKTWFYTGGDERNRQADRAPVAPSVPEFLGGKSPRISPVSLPVAASYPGGKSFIRDAERKRVGDALAAARQTLAADRNALTEARLATADAEYASVMARLAADEAKHGTPAAGSAAELAHAASKAERAFKLAAAKEDLAKAGSDVEGAKKKQASATDDKAKAEAGAVLKKAEAALAAAPKAIAAAEAALAKDSNDYTGFSPVFPATSTGRRSALAHWLTARENPLTARVAVNHIWMRHFHSPLVPTVDNFGVSGARPTHPELLDWLAVEFMESGWDMKHLHRLMVTSAAYRRMSSAPGSTAGDATPARRADPENKWLWRMNPGRMEAEVVRDSILHLAGVLDPRMGGQELENKEALTTARRSLYYSFNPESDGRSEFSALFDAPDPTECYRRTRSVIPQQALALTNSKLVHDHAAALLKRLALPESAANAAFITAAFEHILNRPPNAAELAGCESFLAQRGAAAPKEAGARARESLVRVLLNHNDFITVR
ncbi:MAG: DUF1553 domain-containing protein [Chthoniobacteraceae bacterium]